MKYPNRSNTHISESVSFQILSSSLPNEWIIRELTERDYGVDLYVEIVGENKKVTGDLVALQVKSTKSINFNKQGRFTYSGIKKTTINYWIGLPVPVFFILVNLRDNKAYWSSVNINNREGRFNKKTKTCSLVIEDNSDFSEVGLLAFRITYLREKKWPQIEHAIENSIMLYNSLGPLVLMCQRGQDDKSCSTTTQYLLIQHYEYFCLLYRYIHMETPKPIPYWYSKHIEYLKNNTTTKPSHTFSFKVIKEMLRYFIFKYRDCIITCYGLVTESQNSYFRNKFPYLCLHLDNRPYAFIECDWSPRYYLDEYENETYEPEKLFFKDFEEFDWVIDNLTRT